MSSKRHRPHKGGTTPTTEPKDRLEVVQFSVSEVSQFSLSLDSRHRVKIRMGQRAKRCQASEHPVCLGRGPAPQHAAPWRQGRLDRGGQAPQRLTEIAAVHIRWVQRKDYRQLQREA